MRHWRKRVRSILFTADETRSAVAAFLLRRRHARDPYAVECVDIKIADGAVQGCAYMRRDRGDEPAVLDPDELLAAVLMHCRSARIPLSSRSSKRLDVSNGCLVLTMSIAAESAPKFPDRTAVQSVPAPLPTTSRIV